MIINRIYLQNFRSYGHEGTTIELSPYSTTIIGENNIGKTTILTALKIILQLSQMDSTNLDYFNRNSQKKLKISIDCILDDDQIFSIIHTLEFPYSIEEFKKIFSNKITYDYIRIPGKVSLKFQMGFLTIVNGPNPNYCKGFINQEYEENYTGLGWSHIIDAIKRNPTSNPEQIIRDLLIHHTKTNPHGFSIDFTTNVYITILSLLQSKIVFLDEFREKPQSTLIESTTDSTGKELTTVLYNLKMGEKIEDRNNFIKIQDSFNNLFPHLKMDIFWKKGFPKKENAEENYEIEIRKKHIVTTTNYIGSGILQTLYLLTHLIAHPNTILFIDTPELQLHPHIQRRLGTLLQSSQGGQLILLTHSQYFLPITRESRIIRLIQKEGDTKAICPIKDFFTSEDYDSLDQILTIDNKEFFFSRFVLLVEGLSDQWVMQIFASAKNFDLDEHGISVVPVNGNQNFKRYLKILEGFQIPWMIMADSDAEEDIRLVKKLYPNAKIFLLNKELEDELHPAFLLEGRQKFGDGKNKKDKPLKARYAAKKMIEQGIPVPQSISEIIQELIQVVRTP
jgi:putative ATP-dependent endonuclease of OLD family